METLIKERDELKEERDQLKKELETLGKQGVVQNIKGEIKLEAKMWKNESRITELNHHIYMDWLRNSIKNQ